MLEEPSSTEVSSEHVLRHIAEGTASATGDEFFRCLARALAASLHMPIATVGALVDPNRTLVRTLAFWLGDRFVTNVTYSLEGTPCHDVCNGSVRFYQSGVQQRFPRDSFLREKGIESYFGIPLIDSQGTTVGLITVMDIRERQRSSMAESVLRIFAQRASAELERKRTDQELREREQQLELAIEGSRVGLWDWRPLEKKVSFSLHWRRLFGYPPDLPPLNMREGRALIHPEDLPQLWREVLAGLKGRIPYFETEHRIRKANGDYAWVLERGKVAERDAEGHAVRVVGTHMDITDRKNAELAIEASEKRFRSLIHFASELTMILDPDGRVLYSSPGVIGVLGYGEDELLGTCAFDLVAPEDLEAARRRMQALLESPGLSIFMEMRLRRKEGVYAVVEAIGSNLLHEESVAGIVVNVRDVTERTRIQEQVRRSEERFRLLVQRAQDILVIIDRAGCIVHASPSLHQITGYTEAELLGSSIVDLAIEADRDVARRRIRDVIDGLGDHDPTEYRMRTKAGNLRIIEVLATNLLDEESVRGIVINARDISDRRKLEEQMLQTQKLESLGVLAGGIAHDFNNLLMGMLGNAELVKQELDSESPFQPALSDILAAGRRAADLVSQMLAYAGQGPLDVRIVDLNSLITEMSHLLLASRSKKVEVLLELAPDLPLIEADAAQLQQVVMNLITNGAEAIGGAAGQLTLRTGILAVDAPYLANTILGETLVPGVYLFLEASDTGCGIDQETLARIFDPFFTTKFLGRGLGLAAVLGIVRGHKGALRIQSAPGEGSTFTVLFPAAPVQPRRFKSAPRVEEWTHEGRALVIDDEDGVRTVCQRSLEKMKFEVTVAADGGEGLRILQAHPDAFDLVLLDVTMPGVGGEEVYRELKKLGIRAPVVLMSGYEEEAVAHRFDGTQAPAFLHKPFSFSALQSTLRQILGG